MAWQSHASRRHPTLAFAAVWAHVTAAGLLSTFPLPVSSSGDVAKQVVSTSWWPPGTEKQAESVGILSHGFVYMTGMMEVNATLEASTRQELYDVRDIAQAAGAGMEDLVDCIVNTPAGAAGAVRRSFEAALPAMSRPALTFVEMPGEYVFCPTSISCVAAQPAPGQGRLRRLRWQDTYGVVVRGLLHVQGVGGSSGTGVRQEAAEALAAISGLVRSAGGAGLSSLIDCTAFLRDIGDASALREALMAVGAEPSLTVARAGLEDPKQSVLLRCVVALPVGQGVPAKVHRIRSESGLAVVTDRFVYTSGQLGSESNGTDAFASLEKLLATAGATLDDVVNCHFFVKETEKVFDLFAGFQQVFNQNHPPPPSRTEFTSVSECARCAVVAKCVAARRSVRHPVPLFSDHSTDNPGVVLV